MPRALLAAWSVSELLAAVVAQVIITPLLLHRFDKHNFSAWVIAQSALLAAPLLSAGTSIALLSAAGAHRSSRSAIHVGLKLLLERTTTTTFVLTGLIGAGWIVLWLSGQLATRLLLDFCIIVFVSLIWMAATELDSGLSSALKAHDGFVACAKLEVVARVLQVALIFCLIPLQGSALAAILISLAVVVVKVAAKLILLLASAPIFKSLASKAQADDTDAGSSFSANGRWICLGVVSGLALNAFDRWSVGAQFGPADLAAYAICSQIAQLPHAIAAAAAQVLTPWAAVRVGRLDDPVVCGHILRVCVLSTLLAGLPSIIMLAALQPVLGYWISPSFADQNLGLARGLLAAFAVLTLNVPSFYLALGLGQSRVVTVINAVAAAIFAVACLAFDLSLPMFVAVKGICFALTLMTNVHLVWLLRGRLRTSTVR